MKRLILLGVLAAFFLICFEKDNAIGQTDGSLKWAFQTGAQVFSSPAIGTDGTIYVGSGISHDRPVTQDLRSFGQGLQGIVIIIHKQGERHTTTFHL